MFYRDDDYMAKGLAWATVSLFSGCGGFDLGAVQSGLYDIVFAADNDHWAVETYRKNIGNHVVEADIRGLAVPDVPCDVLIAGPPCQDFSSLWNHDGIITPRGNLFREVARFLNALRPAAFVLENVPGLLSANHGQAWTAVRQALRSPGTLFESSRSSPRYRLRAEKINMADLGVPQLRERLIVIGIREDLNVEVPKISRPFKNRHITAGQALLNSPLPPLGQRQHEIGFDSEIVVERLKMIPPGRNYTSIPQNHRLAVKGMISHVYKRLHPDEPAYTIIASGGGGTYGYHFAEHRRLSNRERARLQSFPDSFAFAVPPNLPAARKQVVVRRLIGNAVPPVAGSVILSDVAKALRDAGIEQRSREDLAEFRRAASPVSSKRSGYDARITC